MASTYFEIGILYLKKNYIVQALNYFNKALKIEEKILGEKNENTAKTYHYIAQAYQACHEFEVANYYYSKAVNAYKK